ncbi:glutaredoxin family protein [Methylophilus sp. 5]|uniref:glutaredoxin family protein n=1 Tax=Methylophilus sp. 5 TaxID=1112274 RepID=UPI001E593F86|nr:glutaredoxin family protein [Methylophilus sp. 5]
MSSRLKFFIIGAGILLAMEWRAWLYYLAPPPDYSHGKIVLYATDWCPYCEKTRALLQQRHITYQELNIETSAEGSAQYQRLAGKGVPVLLIAGEVVRGYNEKRIVEALDQWQARQALTIKGK